MAPRMGLGGGEASTLAVPTVSNLQLQQQDNTTTTTGTTGDVAGAGLAIDCGTILSNQQQNGDFSHVMSSPAMLAAAAALVAAAYCNNTTAVDANAIMKQKRATMKLAASNSSPASPTPLQHHPYAGAAGNNNVKIRKKRF